MKLIKKNKEDIKRVNLMIINTIHSFPIEDLMEKFLIKEDIIRTIKNLSNDQILKLVETNQLLVRPNDMLIKNNTLDL